MKETSNKAAGRHPTAVWVPEMQSEAMFNPFASVVKSPMPGPESRSVCPSIDLQAGNACTEIVPQQRAGD
ncbi:MAG: hypothetical protein ACREU2_02165 [Steroidobacteraceae bacterium]